MSLLEDKERLPPRATCAGGHGSDLIIRLFQRGTMKRRKRDLLRAAYAACNRRELEALLALMHPAVEWANGLGGGTVHGPEALRAYCASLRVLRYSRAARELSPAA